MNADDLPDDIIVTDEDGNAKAFVNVDRLQSDATRLMYAMAVTAGDDDATDKVGADWATQHDPDYFGYLSAAALSLLTRNILAPVLDVAEARGVDLRAGLREAAAAAEETLG